MSILLAARNEEKLIRPKTLEGYGGRLNYPVDPNRKYLSENDASTDCTAELVQDFYKRTKSQFPPFLKIDKTVGKGRGKANVLGQLAHKASGEYYFITDVDVKLPSDWVLGLLAEFDEKVGIVSGTTKCERGWNVCHVAKYRLATLYGVHKGFCQCKCRLYECR